MFNIEVCKFDNFNVFNAIIFNIFHPFMDLSSLLTAFYPLFLSQIYLRSCRLANPWEVEMENVEKLEWLIEVMEDLVFFPCFFPDHLKE